VKDFKPNLSRPNLEINMSIPPPRPLSQSAFNKRLTHLQMEFPDRKHFSAREIDPALNRWMIERERFVIVNIIGLLAVGAMIAVTALAIFASMP
jgi:hypothetical protein